MAWVANIWWVSKGNGQGVGRENGWDRRMGRVGKRVG